ncbi:hypothetical protein ACFLVI_01190 [Chloroflexota bacterium]
MAEQLCPVCGCDIVDAGFEMEGETYCCEPCITTSSCECGCCHVAEDEGAE